MYTLDDLSVMLLSELKEIAEKLGIKNHKKLAKQDLIYAILDQQASMPEGEIKKIKSETLGGALAEEPKEKEEKKPRPKKEAPKKEKSDNEKKRREKRRKIRKERSEGSERAS